MASMNCGPMTRRPPSRRPAASSTPARGGCSRPSRRRCGSNCQATSMPRVTPPVCVNSIRRCVGQRALDRLPADGDRAAARAHGEAPIAVGGWHAAHVAIVRQPLRPALDLGRQRKDPLVGSADAGRASRSAWHHGQQHLRQEDRRQGVRGRAQVAERRSQPCRELRAALRGVEWRNPSLAAWPAFPGPARSARPWRQNASRRAATVTAALPRRRRRRPAPRPRRGRNAARGKSPPR